MINDELSFLSQNVKGIKASELKLLEYFRILSNPVGFVLLQETQFSLDVKNNSRIIVFSHSKTNYCGAAIGYYGKTFQE